MAQQCFSKEKLNFLKVADGLAYSGRILATYTLSGLEAVHRNIHARLANYKLCQDNCSRDYGANFGRYMFILFGFVFPFIKVFPPAGT